MPENESNADAVIQDLGVQLVNLLIAKSHADADLRRAQMEIQRLLQELHEATSQTEDAKQDASAAETTRKAPAKAKP